MRLYIALNFTWNGCISLRTRIRVGWSLICSLRWSFIHRIERCSHFNAILTKICYAYRWCFWHFSLFPVYLSWHEVPQIVSKRCASWLITFAPGMIIIVTEMFAHQRFWYSYSMPDYTCCPFIIVLLYFTKNFLKIRLRWNSFWLFWM